MLLIAFVSFLFSWKADQSLLNQFAQREIVADNWLSKFGAQISHFFMYSGFGVASFYVALLITFTGLYLFLNISIKKLHKFWFWGLAAMLWLSVLLSFILPDKALLSGVTGFELNMFLQDFIGKAGVGAVLLFMLILYFIIRLNITPDLVISKLKSSKKAIEDDFSEDQKLQNELNSESTSVHENSDINNLTKPSTEEKSVEVDLSSTHDDQVETEITEPKSQPKEKIIIESQNQDDVAMEVETAEEEDEVDATSKKLVEDFGEFDPTLELANYQFPSIDLLKDYNKGKSITIDQSELESNKNKIVETLKNYKIGIAEIKATVGPTVTLYEIIPEAGIRISKIKNLEDDIALSLSALGIRIIAPIPGRGTIGIEVPNQNPSVVPMRSVVASSKFQESKMALPIAFGKTISNETFVVDLAKMPHLLMAGATGQGKSVGLNVILTSLLYQKHPAEVKFILVDPKKVELTLFNKIERHYLAKMPDVEEAIITDNSKVINTLNSLCIEMDSRYDLLKDAMVRNIAEYNEKFKARKLNPENGHKFLPYIVLVVDEFADLIMTAGKEVETPIARLAQLARAIGIHLIIATQRPSVNVITGMIKANFPARLAFRVTSKIDSRTILDAGGADQLIGRGDMLFTQGNDLVRLQCAFVDTPEVERITDFIGSQKAYPDAHLLPEYQGEEGGTSLDDNIDERDQRFKEAAEIIVTAQQGSASLLQRKMKLGYNRAGRIIDQLEAAGIVGPFEGSKARQVLVTDLTALEQLLE
ncbi:DNA translocase FtsK [Psychroflexus salis]|uniref:DNA translocase FtsK n=2 Tax=Psychroflexus salis TaxID=1526574 RepID=A0A916ZZ97_9FLAO|nr:DNA translocase FtsK [Psychroflexus salis]